MLTIAEISRLFLQKYNVYRYQMKKVEDLKDEDIIAVCHRYYEENHLVDEWLAFRKELEAEYNYCLYLGEYIEEGMCCDTCQYCWN